MKPLLLSFVYEDHLVPIGLLPRTENFESSAAWHLAKLAHKALEKIPEQVTYEGEVDKTIRLMNIAKGVALHYALNLEDIMKFMPAVRLEALRTKKPWNPRFQAWLDSGGKSYNEVTREPPTD